MDITELMNSTIGEFIERDQWKFVNALRRDFDFDNEDIKIMYMENLTAKQYLKQIGRVQ